MNIGVDGNGPYKILSDGQCLRISKQLCNTILTLSRSQAAFGWEHGW